MTNLAITKTLILATENTLIFDMLMDDGLTYTVKIELSDEIFRGVIKAHLLVLYSNFTWPTDAPRHLFGGFCYGSIYSSDGTAYSGTDGFGGPGVIGGEDHYIAKTFPDTTLGIALFSAGGRTQTDGAHISCDGATRSEVPLGGLVLEKAFDFAGYQGGTQFQWSAEDIVLWQVWVIGRRWDSKYILPPDRCYYTGLVESTNADGCFPAEFGNADSSACEFTGQLITNGSQTGFFAPLNESTLDIPDHIVCARLLTPCQQFIPSEPTLNPARAEAGVLTSVQFNLSCPP